MSRGGTLSRMHKRGKMRRGKPNRHPLRKIVGFQPRSIMVDGAEIAMPAKEVLECGHKVNVREDFIGPVTASIGQRRRCKFCPEEPTP